MKNLIQKSRVLVASSLTVAVLAASVIGGFGSHMASAAAACDPVNIVYCGINGSDDASYITSFKSIYNSDKSGHSASSTKKDFTDVQSVYAWAGATSAMVNSMNTTNTKVGAMYRDGHIVVNGKTVGTGAWVSARFTNGSGFTKISDGVWARKTTTSLAEATAPVLVYMPNSQMAFAGMIACANAVKATPVKVVTPPTPTPTKPVTPVTTTTVTPPVVTTAAVTTPTVLPNTGPGDILGLFAGTGIAGAAARTIVTRRRK